MTTIWSGPQRWTAHPSPPRPPHQLPPPTTTTAILHLLEWEITGCGEASCGLTFRSGGFVCMSLVCVK
ncbi:hypothetical protein AALO_G00098710 [Alosa alosa]|uniref:Uncharacterized protein n=1 Tax=Alosa alosa TaxID=278164 RepID=A0AAV6GTE3_9TELE|nr:hypothetical protein AALO_G00098710 [Alosa alosa]